MGYIPRQVKIEAGTRSDDWPTEEETILTYVAEAFRDSDRITEYEVAVGVLSIQGTFLGNGDHPACGSQQVG